jgi:capsular polysaccharide transport system permease protein
MANSDSPIRIGRVENNFGSLLRIQARVCGTIMLRDLKTRFGSSALSYLVAVIWPAMHVGLILSIYLVLGRLPVFGTDLMTWSFTGALCFVLFIYPFRFIGMSLADGSALLGFPIVQPIDLIVAKCVLESLTAVMYSMFIYFGLALAGWHIEIHHLATALEAWLAALFFGIGVGVFFAPLVRMYKFAMLLGTLLTITAWFTSGNLFLPDSIPDPYNYYLSFNPLMHAMEWFRKGVYFDYTSETLNKTYLLSVSSVLVFTGLVVERYTRGVNSN